jgi:hypothetical protein
MPHMDRRTLLTALVGACAAVGTLGAAATSAIAVPRAAPPKPEADLPAAAPHAEGEAQVHQAQVFVYRRRRRRRWFVARPRRRRRVYFY